MGEYSAEYAAWALLVALGTGLALLLLVVRRRVARRDAAGPPIPAPRSVGRRLSSRARDALFLVAVPIGVLQVGLLLLYPWATVVRELGRPALLAGLPVLAALGVGLIHVWRRGGLEWD